MREGEGEGWYSHEQRSTTKNPPNMYKEKGGGGGGLWVCLYIAQTAENILWYIESTDAHSTKQILFSTNTAWGPWG